MKERGRDKDKEREQEEEGREVYGRGSPVCFHLQFELARNNPACLPEV